MPFPTTIEEALNLTPEKAGEYIDLLETLLVDKSSDWMPPDDLEDDTVKFMLAAMIHILNKANSVADCPLAPDWTAHLPEECLED